MSLFTSFGKKSAFLIQDFLPERKSEVPIVLICADDETLSHLSTTALDSEVIDRAVLTARELGACGFLTDFGFKSPLVNIDPCVEKIEAAVEKTAPIFNFKIVFPSKIISGDDSKTPEIKNKLIPFSHPTFSGKNIFAGLNLNAGILPYSCHLLAKKNDSYFANMHFSSVLEVLGAPAIRVTNSCIELKNGAFPDGVSFDSLKIPRAHDGSVLLKYPKNSWKNEKSLSFLEFCRLQRLEDNLYKYLKIMAERGLFGELNSENPLELFEKALSAKKNFSMYTQTMQNFYVLMAAYLSGNQERILLDSVSDAGKRTIVSNSFATCRSIFSELETCRTKLSDVLRDSFCVFSLTADSAADFIPAPGHSQIPKALLPYVLARMIFAGDFIYPFTLIAFDFLLSILFVVLLSTVFLLKKHAARKDALSKTFLQSASESVMKQIESKTAHVALNGQKSESTVLALSIYDISSLSSLFDEKQLLAFLNYYFEKVSALVLDNDGIIESFRNDEIIALFGSPAPDEKHVSHAVKAAIAAKGLDFEINADISAFPKSPKPDGMDDDLYTAFFILNHNEKKICVKSGIYSTELASGCLGSAEKKSYHIIDDSWKKACSVKNLALKLNAAGVFVNERAAEGLNEEYIIRKIPLSISERQLYGERLFELMGLLSSDDEKLWNYTNFWNQAVDLQDKGETEKALAMFKKLSEGRPSDRLAKYFIKSLNRVE